MAVRLANEADIPVVAGILRQAFTPIQDLYTPACFHATVVDEARLLARWREGPTWLAADLGTIGAVLRDDGVYIRSMAVSPAARGRGIGTALMDAVEAYAGQLGVSRMYLSTTPFLHAAIRLYERLGFRRIDGPPHDLHGTPLWNFEKRF